MDVTFDEVSAEVQREPSPEPPPPMGQADTPSLVDEQSSEMRREARAERLRARLTAF
jgi:hypothetical protein